MAPVYASFVQRNGALFALSFRVHNVDSPLCLALFLLCFGEVGKRIIRALVLAAEESQGWGGVGMRAERKMERKRLATGDKDRSGLVSSFPSGWAVFNFFSPHHDILFPSSLLHLLTCPYPCQAETFSPHSYPQLHPSIHSRISFLNFILVIDWLVTVFCDFFFVSCVLISISTKYFSCQLSYFCHHFIFVLERT